MHSKSSVHTASVEAVGATLRYSAEELQTLIGLQPNLPTSSWYCPVGHVWQTRLLVSVAGEPVSYVPGWQSCTGLQAVPTFTGNTNAVTNASGMFQTCQSLEQIPAISFNNITSTANGANMFTNCNNLQRSFMANIKYTHSYVNCKMSNVEINSMFSNLGTTTANTITVTGNPGASTCTTTIATGKGWTVTV
jgi:hypothetical protein